MRSWLGGWVFGAVVVALAACGGDEAVVSTGAPASSDAAAATSLLSSPTSALSTAPTTASSLPPPVGHVADPVEYLSADDRAELAPFGPMLLPAWLPDWASEADAVVGVEPTSEVIRVSWQLDPFDGDEFAVALGSSVWIEVSRRPLAEAGDFDWGLQPEHRGQARTYWLAPAAGNCSGFAGEAVLVWVDGEHLYGVSMFPQPGCAPGITMDQATRFADSLVRCAVEADRVTCT